MCEILTALGIGGGLAFLLVAFIAFIMITIDFIMITIDYVSDIPNRRKERRDQ